MKFLLLYEHPENISADLFSSKQGLSIILFFFYFKTLPPHPHEFSNKDLDPLQRKCSLT